jgi:hypothetical protein
MVRYTGDDIDSCVCYEFQMDSPPELFALIQRFQTGPSPAGIFVNLPTALIQAAWMMEVSSGDFEASVDDVNVLSILMLMTNVQTRATGAIANIWNDLKEWRLSEKDPKKAIQNMMGEIRNGLVRMHFLPANAPKDGILHRQTLFAMQKCLRNDSKVFEFSPKVYEYIRKLAG